MILALKFFYTSSYSLVTPRTVILFYVLLNILYENTHPLKYSELL